MRVLISGAGVAGPTLAWFLSRIGASVTVVEKCPALLPHGQNVDIQGSAVTAVKKMGLLDEVKRNNTNEKGTKFIDQNGKSFAALPVKQGSSTASFTSEYEILRGDLAKLLFNASKNHPNVQYLFDTTIEKVISNDHDSVKVELSNGRVESYDLLVAADGQWSKVRKQCFPRDSIKIVDKNMYAIYFTIPRLPTDDDWWNIYVALGSKIISLRPDPHGTIRAMFTRMPCDSAQKEAWQKASKGGRKMQEALLKSDFSNAGWQAERLLDVIDQCPDFHFQALQQIKMNKWSTSRVICLGDTAYAPTPLTGQGTTLAIIGAYLLAGELSKLEKDEHPSKALDAYEATFRPFVERIQDIPSFIPGVAHPETASKRWLLQTFLWTLARVIQTVYAIPWIVDKFRTTNEENNDGFPLPEYPKLNQACVESKDSEKSL